MRRLVRHVAGHRGVARLRRFGGEERGAAVVEFALVLPVFMLLVFMFIDATRAFYTVNSLVSAAREGARFGAMQVMACPGPTNVEKDRIRDRVIQSAVLFGGQQLTRSVIDVSFGTGGGGSCENVHVKIDRYPFRPFTPVASMFGVDSIPITREAVFRWERAP